MSDKTIWPESMSAERFWDVSVKWRESGHKVDYTRGHISFRVSGGTSLVSYDYVSTRSTSVTGYYIRDDVPGPRRGDIHRAVLGCEVKATKEKTFLEIVRGQ